MTDREELAPLPDKYILAENAFEVFRNSQNGVDATGERIPEFEYLPTGQGPWLKVALKGCEILEDCTNLTWVKFAEDLYSVWAQPNATLEFNVLLPQSRFAWEAVAKYLATVLASEGGNPDDFKDKYIGFAVKKAQELKALIPA